MYKRLIKKVVRRLGYEIKSIGDVDLLESLIYKNLRKDFFFIQIGANDGKRFDPIFEIVNELKLAGLVIEPVKSYFDELVSNYKKNPNVVPVNKAIYEENGKVSIFRVKENSTLPDWSHGIASLDSEHYKKSNTDKRNIIEEKVDAITFDSLFKKYNVKNVDLLQIDTEGYDYNLIKSFPFEVYKPSLIHFEHGLPNKIMSFEQFLEIHMMLVNLGYKTITKEYDMIGYL